MKNQIELKLFVYKILKYMSDILKQLHIKKISSIKIFISNLLDVHEMIDFNFEILSIE